MCRWLQAKVDLFLKSFASSQRDDTRQFSLSGTRQYLWWSLPRPRGSHRTSFSRPGAISRSGEARADAGTFDARQWELSLKDILNAAQFGFKLPG